MVKIQNEMTSSSVACSKTLSLGKAAAFFFPFEGLPLGLPPGLLLHLPVLLFGQLLPALVLMQIAPLPLHEFWPLVIL